MGVPREDLLLMTRALKSGLAHPKAIRTALDRPRAKPTPLLCGPRLSPPRGPDHRGGGASPPGRPPRGAHPREDPGPEERFGRGDRLRACARRSAVVAGGGLRERRRRPRARRDPL